MVAARNVLYGMRCLVWKKERERGKWEMRGKLVALGSDQSHSSTAKAALIAGVRYKSVIACRMEDDLAMTGCRPPGDAGAM
jgi:glutamate/tyrosine decarboxylase-like PLP-dependent enzyme